jgi:hypothetical protein
MHFNKESIDRFIAIYERKFGETLTSDEATAMARRLVNLYRLFHRPLPSSPSEELKGTGTPAEVRDPSSHGGI